jgi:hypothetical protein
MTACSSPPQPDAPRPGLVEFALVLPIFVLFMVAIFDLGRAAFAYNTLTNAAREGARMAIVNQYRPSIIARAKQQTAIVELNDPSVSVELLPGRTADGTPNLSVPVRPEPDRRRLHGDRQLRGDLPADHAAHREHRLQERRDVHRQLHAFGGYSCPATGMTCRRGQLSEAAMRGHTVVQSRSRHRQRGQVIPSPRWR